MNDEHDFNTHNLQFTAAVENAIQHALIKMNFQSE